MTRENLLAPWRMEYLENYKLEGCFICSAINADNDQDNFILCRGTHSIVMLNRYPYNNGHIMIIPKRHITRFTDLERDELFCLTRWIQAAEKVLMDIYRPDGMNMGVNIGSAGGAGLRYHLHVHMMPRWEGDTNFITTCGEIRVMPEMLCDTYLRLAPQFRKVRETICE